MRNTGEVGKDMQLKTDLLHVAIVDIYLNLKKQINKYNKKGMQTQENQEEEEEDSNISEQE